MTYQHYTGFLGLRRGGPSIDFSGILSALGDDPSENVSFLLDLIPEILNCSAKIVSDEDEHASSEDFRRPLPGTGQSLLLSPSPNVQDEAPLHAIVKLLAYQLRLRNERKRIAEVSQQADIYFHACPTPLILQDRRGVIRDANRAIVRLLGRSRDELVGLKIPRILSADCKQPSLDAFREVRRTGSATFHAKILPSSGDPVTVEVTCRELHNNGESLILGSLREIPEEKSDLHRKYLHEHSLEQSLDSASDAVLLYNDLGYIFKINPKFTEFLGHNPQDILESSLDTIFAAESLSALRKAIRLLMKEHYVNFRAFLAHASGAAIPCRIIIIQDSCEGDNFCRMIIQDDRSPDPA